MSKPVKNNSQLLYLQARQLFEQAKAKFDDGTIKSEPTLVTAVFNSFQDFFASMGKPNLVPRYAPEEGPPWSEDYNNMMNEIKSDLELLFQEIDILGRSLYSDFNHNMVQQEILTEQYQSVLDKMRDLELYAGLSTDNRVEFGRDDFLNKSKIDYSRISGTPLEIVDGAVTLPQESRENVAPDASVTIIAGNREANKFIIGTESNGFPGNNTEIHSVTDDVLTNKNYIPTFLGEEDNHSDYSVVLDGSPNTWFEYEKVNVREQDKVRVAKNLGWNYQVHENQTLQWAEDPENGILKLHVQIILPEEKIINQINCNMYTPPNYGAKTAIVKNILVSDGKESPHSILPKDKTDDQYSFHFPPESVKVVSVLFEQSQKYITDIGHIFYEKKMQTDDDAEYAMDMATKKYKYAPRVDGPLIALEDLGIEVKVSDSTVEADYPLLTDSGTETNSIGETINRLTSLADMDTVDMGVERFEGFRWAIGIRDIEIYSCEYATEGELVTVPFYFDKPMDKISLNVNENIPEMFTNDDALKYEWLKYFVSIDDGATWYPITPLSQEVVSDDQPPKIYTVRTIETSDQQLDDKENYIESEYPVYSLRMKIVARRPDDYTTEGFMLKDAASTPLPNNTFKQASPIVSSYAFSVTTVKDISDSDESDRVAANVNNIGSGISLDPGEGEPPTNTGGDSSNSDTSSNQNLTVVIKNKKVEWCSDEDLIVKGQAYSDNPLDKAELYINNELMFDQNLSGTIQDFEFTITKQQLEIGTMTMLLKAYDSKGVAIDSDLLNVIDCTDIPGEDRPQDTDPDKLSIVIDKKDSEICECDNLIFYGSVQGPNEIRSVTFSINGISVDPNDLGTPPDDNPCMQDQLLTTESVSNPEFVSLSTKSPKEMTDEELMAIEDFGEWLDAFEEREDCGCKNKKKSVAPQFSIQATPFHMLQINEQNFQVTIPFWKIRDLGITLNSSMEVAVTAIDSINQEVQESFEVLVKDCENPPTDANGNPRVRDCYQLESIEVYYYDYDSESIISKVIPYNALPYEGITNGAGSGITVGWSIDASSPIIMQTFGYDDSGFAFQIHAVGIHYLDEYDQPQTEWTQMIGDTSEGVKNSEKMIGDPSRSSDWTNDIQNANYYTSPSLGGINDYAVFLMDNNWIEKACQLDISDFSPSQYEKPEEPEEDPNLAKINDCLDVKFVVFQYYNDLSKQLETYKVEIDAEKDTYDIQTQNGNVSTIIGWSNYFKGPAMQIQSASGTNNILLTAIGVIYLDMYGESQTAWSTFMRFQVNGPQYPENATGEIKDLSEIDWITDGTVDYTQATYVGKQGSLVAYTIDEALANQICDTVITIDEEIGLDISNPPDMPWITYDQTQTVCVNRGNIELNAVGHDTVGIKEVEYTIFVNDEEIYGPYTESYDDLEFDFSYPVPTDSIIAGDTIRLYAKVTNQFNVSAEKDIEIIAESCDPVAKIEGEITVEGSVTYSLGQDIDMGNFMSEWTQWHDIDPGNWVTQNNGGQTELTNTINQNGYSGWYNNAHMSEYDYYFEMAYQARGGDDDMMGAFFRVQPNAVGFYSVEHDGGDSWVNGKGVRIFKHEGTTKTLLAEDASAGWTINAHRAYKITVTLEGSKITVDLYGDTVTSRKDGEIPEEPIQWVHITTLTATDATFTHGAWGPITNSNPDTYFWGLKMVHIATINKDIDPVLQRNISVSQLQLFDASLAGTSQDIQLTETAIKEEFSENISRALSNQSIDATKVLFINYKITSSTLEDAKETMIPINKLKFVPTQSANAQETRDETAVVWANVLVDY